MYFVFCMSLMCGTSIFNRIKNGYLLQETFPPGVQHSREEMENWLDLVRLSIFHPVCYCFLSTPFPCRDCSTLQFLACQGKVSVGDSGLCCCVCVTSFEHELTPLFAERLFRLNLTHLMITCAIVWRNPVSRNLYTELNYHDSSHFGETGHTHKKKRSKIIIQYECIDLRHFLL